MQRFLDEIGANPGRSGHRLANEAERVRFGARAAVAELFHVADPPRVVFTLNGTTALNLVLRGLLKPGGHVVTTSMEHNAVMRPLRMLETVGVTLSIVNPATDGTLDPAAIAAAIRDSTRLIVVNHASNVSGTLLPVREIGAIARSHDVPLLVDAAQTGGCVPIDIERDNIDLLAFCGHKGLLGPSGTGGLAIGPHFDIEQLPPLIAGGTGSVSEHETQPTMLPDKYEAGTCNAVGLAGLAAGVAHVLAQGVASIASHEQKLAQRLIDGLGKVPGVRVVGPRDAAQRTAVVSFTHDARSPSEVAHALDERHEIMCRPGLHCAPAAHRTLGTIDGGTVRLSAGYANTTDEIDTVIDAVRQIVSGK